jgi:rfaE bifunctional protein kinase chain/domain
MLHSRAKEILDSFAGRRVLVVGDVMLDEYVWGRVSRVSPEAPVMVVDADHHTYVPGGAANVVNNVCALGGQAMIAGLVGADGAGRTLAEKLAEEGADVTGLMVSDFRPTTQKTRIIAHSQQVVRVDHEMRDPISPEEEARLIGFLETAIPQCDAVLLSDYQKGLLGRTVVQKTIEAARAQGKISAGNLKPQGINSHCRLTMITLNLSEASTATGMLLSEGSGDGMLREAGRMLLRKSGADHILITRGAQGLTLFSRDTDPVTVPAHPVAVYDVAGAGDTVISTLTLALAAGASALEAVTIANCAGAVVVRKVGVATATPEEILALVSDAAEAPSLQS